MQNTAIKVISTCLVTGTLIGCNGGGSGGGGAAPGTNGGQGGGVGPELVIEFREAPLDPKVFNLLSNDRSTENHFNPEEKLSITWMTTVKYSDDTTLGVNQRELYQAKVYLSDNDIIEIDNDLELFTIQCSFPMASGADYGCSEFASFESVYAKDNLNQFSTTSIPLNKPEGIQNHVVDATDFLDIIPKDANVIIETCLISEPDNCAEASVAIELY